jgi:hypothetical protein
MLFNAQASLHTPVSGNIRQFHQCTVKPTSVSGYSNSSVNFGLRYVCSNLLDNPALDWLLQYLAGRMERSDIECLEAFIKPSLQPAVHE